MSENVVVSREILQQALEALDSDHPDVQLRAAVVLRAALAQQEQEPVAWRFKGMMGMPWSLSDDGYYVSCKRDKGYIVEPLWASSPRRETQQEPVSRSTINELMRDAGWQNSAIRQVDLDKVEKVVRAVEAKLKEKNHA